jgi:hypothetical protein
MDIEGDKSTKQEQNENKETDSMVKYQPQQEQVGQIPLIIEQNQKIHLYKWMTIDDDAQLGFQWVNRVIFFVYAFEGKVF